MKVKHGALAGIVTACVIFAAAAATFAPPKSAADRGLASCAPELRATQWPLPAIVGEDGRGNIDEIMRAASKARAVFIGEVHNRLEHHRAQLELICRLHRSGAQVAIGVEFFQQPFQAYLDDYIAGEIDERELVRLTDYERRWGFDFGLYAPILSFARANGIRLVALNVPTELTKAVARRGLDRLTAAERAFLPARMDRTSADYVKRLKVVFDAHPKGGHTPFEHFLEAQLLWDEGMAAEAAEYLASHPRHTMVILAGNGHVEWRDGIPNRLARRIDVNTVVISQTASPVSSSVDEADFMLVHGAPRAWNVASGRQNPGSP